MRHKHKQPHEPTRGRCSRREAVTCLVFIRRLVRLIVIINNIGSSSSSRLMVSCRHREVSSAATPTGTCVSVAHPIQLRRQLPTHFRTRTTHTRTDQTRSTATNDTAAPTASPNSTTRAHHARATRAVPMSSAATASRAWRDCTAAADAVTRWRRSSSRPTAAFHVDSPRHRMCCLHQLHWTSEHTRLTLQRHRRETRTTGRWERRAAKRNESEGSGRRA